MANPSSSFTLRLSSDLRRLLEESAKKREVSLASEIVAACWMWLEEPNGAVAGSQTSEAMTQGKSLTAASNVAVILDRIGSAPIASENLAAAPKPDMQSLRGICAGSIPRHHDSVNSTRDAFLSPLTEIPICGKRWWEDGSQYECLMDSGHREPKHGLRGMVRRLDD